MILNIMILIFEMILAVYGLICLYKILLVKIDSYPILLLIFSALAMLTLHNESIIFRIFEFMLICLALYNINKKFKLLIYNFKVKRAIGKDGKNYIESKYLQFDEYGHFYYEVRDKRYRNTFFVSEKGEIKDIYFGINKDTPYQIGDYIDITNPNIFISGHTFSEMRRYEKTRNFMKENLL